MLICLVFEMQVASLAFSLACAKTGKRIAAKIAMIAITTSSSIKVNPVENPDCSGVFRLISFVFLF